MNDIQELATQLALITAALELQTQELEREKQLHSVCKSQNEELKARMSSVSQDSSNKVLSLKQVVSLMYKEDENAVIIVRRIQKLGFKSAAILRHFFSSTFGCLIKKIHVVHSRSKGSSDVNKGTVRPANMAFILMESPSEVTKVFSFPTSASRTVSIRDKRNPQISADEVVIQHFVKHSLSSDTSASEDGSSPSRNTFPYNLLDYIGKPDFSAFQDQPEETLLD